MPNKLKNLPLFFLFLLGIFILSSCGNGVPRASFVVGVEDYPKTLDPREGLDAYSMKVQQLLFNGLMRIDEKMQLVPDLAESYSFLSDTKLEFRLRQGIKFHDGKILTARDIAYTLNSLIDPQKNFTGHEAFQKISNISVIDDQTLQINLKEVFPSFLNALTVGIIPEKSDEISSKPFRERPIGTGPFQFSTLQNDRWIYLRANPEYFRGAPQVSDVMIQTVRDDTTRILKMLRGEIHLLQNSVPLAMVRWLAERSNLLWESRSGINLIYLGLNLQDPILKNPQVRRAMALALNRDQLIKNYWGGLARKATGILAPENPFYEESLALIPYNPEEAKRLLDAAGFPDPDGDGPLPRFSLIYKTSNKRDRVTLAKAIARQFKEVGINVEVRSYEWGTFFSDIRSGNFQIFTSTWVGISDPDFLYYVFDSQMNPPMGNNRGRYKNEQVDFLLQQARQEIDLNSRRLAYAEVQKILAEDLPQIPLWYEDNVVFHSPQFKDYQLRLDASWLGLTQVKK